MTPAQMRQLVTQRPFTVNDVVANWIYKAIDALNSAATQIEKLEQSKKNEDRV